MPVDAAFEFVLCTPAQRLSDSRFKTLRLSLGHVAVMMMSGHRVSPMIGELRIEPIMQR
jgi:hypothetical protein